MVTVWCVAGWPAAGPVPGALGWLRLAASLVIVGSSAHTAWSLWRRRGRGPSRRLAGLAAALIAVCGLSCLVGLFLPQPPARPQPTALRVVSAAFWVVSALYLPGVAARLASPMAGPGASPPGRAGAPPPDPAYPFGGGGGGGGGGDGGGGAPSMAALVSQTGRLEAKARRLERLVRAAPEGPDRSRALRALRDLLVDLEAELCRT